MAKKSRRKSSSRRKRRTVSGNPSLAPAVVSGTRRRRKHTVVGPVRRHHRRVSKVGAITGSETGDMLLGLALGVGAGIGADILANKSFPGHGEMIAGAKAALGIVAAIKVKNPIVKGAGFGITAQAMYSGAKEFGIISGMEEFIHGVGANERDSMLIEMNGTGVNLNSTNIIAGSNIEQPDIISGDEDNYGGNSASGMPSVVG